MKMHLNISSVKWQLFCPGGDELSLSTPSHCWWGDEGPALFMVEAPRALQTASIPFLLP